MFPTGVVSTNFQRNKKTASAKFMLTDSAVVNAQALAVSINMGIV